MEVANNVLTSIKGESESALNDKMRVLKEELTKSIKHSEGVIENYSISSLLSRYLKSDSTNYKIAASNTINDLLDINRPHPFYYDGKTVIQMHEEKLSILKQAYKTIFGEEYISEKDK